jgi:aryl-alcohol dehydrogenase-like predicted oxidoreductase
MGTMTFGKEADRETSAALYKRCRDGGINFFDCANGYAGGESERILGDLMQGHRNDLVITSKVYFAVGPDRNARGANRRHIMGAVEDSLKRLKTDHVDVYFLHHWDPSVPLEDPLRALEDLVSQGKILYPAVSNYAAWQIAKALGISSKNRWAPFRVVQPMYNLLKRQAEVEILPLAQSENLGVISYSPLGGGMLTGKYGTEEPKTGTGHNQTPPNQGVGPSTVNASAPKGRIEVNEIYAKRYGDGDLRSQAQAFADFARERGYHPATLAIAWVAAHPAITAPIIGDRNLEQLEPALAAAEVPMTVELYAQLSALTPTPPPPPDRSEET